MHILLTNKNFTHKKLLYDIIIHGDTMAKRKRMKKGIKTIFVLIILICLITGGLLIYNNYFKSDTEPVSSEIEKLMQEANISKDKYSKTLEFVLLNNIYDESYLDEYSDIEFQDKDNFASILTTFLPLGYSGKEINYITKLSENNIDKLSKIDYVDISNYYEFSNFDVNKIDRYNSYYEDNDYSYKDVITYVNINLDLPVYTDTTEVADPNDLLVLVNKYHYLPDGYKPSDLAYLPGAYGNNVPMREVIIEPFKELQAAAEEEIGVNFMPTTAFRDYNFQRTLYNNYVASDGVTAADTYSARPGYSEHQTGLSIDLKNTAISGSTRLTDENYEWLSNNAYRFGFIIRFPEDKTNITGYQFENWHIRYVGLDAAKIIYEEDLTLEEYINLYVTEY